MYGFIEVPLLLIMLAQTCLRLFPLLIYDIYTAGSTIWSIAAIKQQPIFSTEDAAPIAHAANTLPFSQFQGVYPSDGQCLTERDRHCIPVW